MVDIVKVNMSSNNKDELYKKLKPYFEVNNLGILSSLDVEDDNIINIMYSEISQEQFIFFLCKLTWLDSEISEIINLAYINKSEESERKVFELIKKLYNKYKAEVNKRYKIVKLFVKNAVKIYKIYGGEEDDEEDDGEDDGEDDNYPDINQFNQLMQNKDNTTLYYFLKPYLITGIVDTSLKKKQIFDNITLNNITLNGFIFFLFKMTNNKIKILTSNINEEDTLFGLIKELCQKFSDEIENVIRIVYLFILNTDYVKKKAGYEENDDATPPERVTVAETAAAAKPRAPVRLPPPITPVRLPPPKPEVKEAARAAEAEAEAAEVQAQTNDVLPSRLRVVEGTVDEDDDELLRTNRTVYDDDDELLRTYRTDDEMTPLSTSFEEEQPTKPQIPMMLKIPEYRYARNKLKPTNNPDADADKVDATPKLLRSIVTSPIIQDTIDALKPDAKVTQDQLLNIIPPGGPLLDTSRKKQTPVQRDAITTDRGLRLDNLQGPANPLMPGGKTFKKKQLKKNPNNKKKSYKKYKYKYNKKKL